MTSHSEQHIVAVEWFVKLTSEDVTESVRLEWSEWMSQSDANQKAWAEVKNTLEKFQSIPVGIGMSVLGRRQDKVDIQRRRALKNFAIFTAIALPTSLFVQRNMHTHYDYVTSIGESREVLLSDGTQLALNTDSAVTVEFNSRDRVIKLHHGEILITSGHSHLSSGPLEVETQDGKITPIGTKFNIRKFDDFTRVSLFEGKLKVNPKFNDAEFYMNANEVVDMYPLAVVKNSDVQLNSASWLNGYVEVNNLPLSILVDELTRYQQGYMLCHTELKNLRVSGSYSIKDIDASLNGLIQTFPIKIQHATRYVTILLPET